MRVLYLTTLVWGALGTGTALAMMQVRSALDAWWQLAGIFSGGMLGLFLLGRISRRARNPAAVTAVISGVLVILWMTLSISPQWPESLQHLRSPMHSFMIIVVGTLVILLVGLLVSRFPGRARGGGRSVRPGAKA
jgi:SSS family solute:Na+ symporter